MKDLKIKVDRNNAGEAIDLLVNLGHKLLSTKRGLICEVERGSTHIVNNGNAIFTTKNYYDVEEITLQELRNMANQDQDEPFLTPETTLNDQYAEIEQVRQSGMKFDGNKPRYSLLPKGVVNSVVEVLEFGAKKYSADNWQEVDNAKERYYNAAMRHIDSWWNGEKLDPETNVHHLAHAATNLFFLMWFDSK